PEREQRLVQRALLPTVRERLLLDGELGIEDVDAGAHGEREQARRDVEIEAPRRDQLLLRPRQLPLLERVDVAPLDLDLQLAQGRPPSELAFPVHQALAAVRVEQRPPLERPA